MRDAKQAEKQTTHESVCRNIIFTSTYNFIEEKWLDSHSLNPSAQQRSGGSHVHLNPTGPKRSPKKKFSQISAVQQCS